MKLNLSLSNLHKHKVNTKQKEEGQQKIVTRKEQASKQEYKVGKVKWFDAKKGYGFIVEKETQEDVFVHYTAIQEKGFKKLQTGDVVEFKMINTEKGLRAVNVKIVKKVKQKTKQQNKVNQNTKQQKKVQKHNTTFTLPVNHKKSIKINKKTSTVNKTYNIS